MRISDWSSDVVLFRSSRLGIAELAAVRADRLPTGQARLVELARALATDPTVLLLDEPASGQDASETAAFSELLRAIATHGVAVAMAEHDLPLVMDGLDTIHALATCPVIHTDRNDAWSGRSVAHRGGLV